MPTRLMPWTEGVWTHQPGQVEYEGTDLVVTALKGSDAWRITSYGFVHESEHALLSRLEPGSAVEVTFAVSLSEQFDQAGLFLRASPSLWVKAGLEYVDGTPHVGVVVTDGLSDWSSFPVPAWSGRRATVRASWAGDAVTIRAKVDEDPFHLIRLLPLDPGAEIKGGPYLCAPTRSGLTVRFHSWHTTPPDSALH